MLPRLTNQLKQTPVVYITRDVERALGLPPQPGYYIITNSTPLSTGLAKKNKQLITIKDKTPLDTLTLLGCPETAKLIGKLKNPRLLVFKNTLQIEKFCALRGWPLLNPSATLANTVEEKISQLTWLNDLTKYLPPHKLVLGKNLTWPFNCHSERSEESLSKQTKGSFVPLRMTTNNQPFIVQFNRAHTGTGTQLIDSAEAVKKLQTQFPNRELRVSEYISGPSYTNNNVVWGSNILCGSINYQITGLAPFTNNPFATVGNDWALPAKQLTDHQQKKFTEIATAVGKKLNTDGWKGLFGIDIIVDDTTGLLYLLEVNARQPASTTYESHLQQLVILSKAKNPSSTNVRDPSVPQDDKTTTFEAHLASLLGLPHTNESLASITNGAQIIKRLNTDGEKITQPVLKKLEKLLLNLITYDNTEIGRDLLRIQTAESLMHSHGQLNELGEKIKTILA